MRSNQLKWTLITLFLLWLFFSLGNYYGIHKPFSPEKARQIGQIRWLPVMIDTAAVGRTGLDLLAALWITFAALGAGLWGWQWLAPAGRPPLEMVLLGTGMGFGLLGLVTLFLGLVGWLSTAVFYSLLIILTLVSVPKCGYALRQMRPPPLSRPMILYLILALGLALTVALLPPTNWDGLFYHLKGPKLYIQAGQIQPGIDIPHLNFPSLFEMLFLLAMVIRGDVAAQLLHFVFLFLLAGLVYLMARRLLKVKNGWTAVLFLLATPMVLSLAAWTYNDLALAFYGAAALYTFLQWQSSTVGVKATSATLSTGLAGRDKNRLKPRLRSKITPERRWLILSGVFSGLMMGLKYTSFVTPLFLAGVLVWTYRQQLKNGLKPLLAFGLPAFWVALPWYVKNWLFTGNPVYPFLFNGRFWDEFRAASYGDPGSGVGFDLVALLRLPYDLTLGLADASQDGFTGPLFLAFLPLLLMYGFSKTTKLPPAFKTMLLYGLAYYAFWVVGVIGSAGLWQSRLLLPALVILCPILAWVLEDLGRFDHPQFSLRRFLNMALVFVLLLGLFDQLLNWVFVQPLPYLAGGETKDAHLSRRLGPHYEAMVAINEELPETAVITFLWEPRSYYCDPDCRPDSILDEFDHLVYLYGDAPAIADAWRSEGVTHILLWRAGLDFVLQSRSDTDNVPLPDPPILRQLQQDHMSQVLTIANDSYQVFKLR